MQWPSLTTVLSILFLGYMANSIWSIASLYIPPSCPAGEKTCISSILTETSELSLIMFTTTKARPSLGKDLSYLDTLDIKVSEEKHSSANIKFPKSVIKNGTMYMAVFAVPKLGKVDKTKADWWEKEIYNPKTSYTQTRLTQHSIPEAETFNLLGEETKKEDKPLDRSRPVSHLRSKMVITVMSDQVVMGPGQVPGELGHVMSLTKDRKNYLPILFVDELTMRLRDLRVVNATDTNSDIEIIYQPISFGKLRLFLQFTGALGSMHGMGFTEKDTDEVKGIFADTNLVLLLITFAVSAVHLLFDFLAFKSDVSFWRGKKTVEGLSRKTILWRAFSQTVIFFYLLDEETSLLVLIPAGVGALIEMWKVTKALHIQFSFRSGFTYGSDTAGEANTAQLDETAMKYLSWVLYPLCLVGAVYSLIYTPHKSWYSWTVQTTVNGVYAFGFLFMLPQLFLNYKLKSVAHLPWRAFMYKAFNTFIDDLFAFIITMPTAHRVACFRDDIVFLIYLYQRHLYPVDPTRIDTSVMMDEAPETTGGKQKDD
jgi:CRISPR/Cas system CMR-associated protein Cmr5 small subunit